MIDRRQNMRSKDPLLMDRIKTYVDSYALENGGKHRVPGQCDLP